MYSFTILIPNSPPPIIVIHVHVHVHVVVTLIYDSLVTFTLSLSPYYHPVVLHKCCQTDQRGGGREEGEFE